MPTEESATREDAALDYAAIDWEAMPEKFMFGEEAGDVLAADVAWECLKALSHRQG